MINESMVAILGGIFFILLIGFMVAVVFLVYASLELRKTAAAFKEFLKNVECRITPVLDETEKTLRSVRKVSDDVGTATENVRDLSDAMYGAVRNVRALSGIVEDLRDGVSLRAIALSSGIKAAFAVLMNQIKERRS